MKKSSLLLILLLAACSANGPPYADVSGTEIPDNLARVVVYRPDHTLGSQSSFWVEINGRQACDIHNASFFVKDVAPGPAVLASSRFSAVGTSKIGLDLKPKTVTFVRLDPKSSRALVGMMGIGGVVAQAAMEGSSNSSGPVELAAVPETQAMQEMSGFGSETGCK
jgi:hypothetical protein